MRQDVRNLDVVSEEGQLRRYARRLLEHCGRITGVPVLIVTFDREVSIDTKLCQCLSDRSPETNILIGGYTRLSPERRADEAIDSNKRPGNVSLTSQKSGTCSTDQNTLV